MVVLWRKERVVDDATVLPRRSRRFRSMVGWERQWHERLAERWGNSSRVLLYCACPARPRILSNRSTCTRLPGLPTRNQPATLQHLLQGWARTTYQPDASCFNFVENQWSHRLRHRQMTLVPVLFWDNVVHGMCWWTIHTIELQIAASFTSELCSFY